MTKNDYIIRLEKAEDYNKTENLVRESFWNVYRPGCSEHFVLKCLRNDADFVPQLDFVMEKNGRLIGQNMFMRAIVKADDGREIPIMTMGPICIAPKFKRQGYGKILLDYSLEKATEFLCEYAKAFKEAGASGVVMAEPLGGMLSPSLVGEFSCDYVKKFIDAVSDDTFIVVYHNCGDNVLRMVDDLVHMGAPIYHFGNSIDIVKMDESIKMAKGYFEFEGISDIDFVKRAIELLKEDNPKYGQIDVDFLSFNGTGNAVSFIEDIRNCVSNKKIILFFDRDDAGKKAVSEITHKDKNSKEIKN